VRSADFGGRGLFLRFCGSKMLAPQNYAERNEHIMSKKMVSCKTCGAEIAKSAKTCPACGAKNKKSRLGIVAVVLVAVVVVGAFGGGEDDAPEKVTGSVTSSTSTSQEKVITYTACSVDKLIDDLESNALKAEKTYQDQYLELTGVLKVIDSDGDYVSLYPSDDLFGLTGVQCYMQNDEQVDQVLEMTIGEEITVRGKITKIGEVWGYTLKIDEFVI
jgi:hypothetical protein